MIGKIGISEEVNHQNMAIILQQYSVSKIISSVFQECLINVGVSKIRDRANALAVDNFQNILNNSSNKWRWCLRWFKTKWWI